MCNTSLPDSSTLGAIAIPVPLVRLDLLTGGANGGRWDWVLVQQWFGYPDEGMSVIEPLMCQIEQCDFERNKWFGFTVLEHTNSWQQNNRKKIII